MKITICRQEYKVKQQESTPEQILEVKFGEGLEWEFPAHQSDSLPEPSEEEIKMVYERKIKEFVASYRTKDNHSLATAGYAYSCIKAWLDTAQGYTWIQMKLNKEF